MSSPVKLAPSILAADFSRLGEEVQNMTAAGADWLHLDVMDGHFVPNISFGPAVIQSLRPLTDIPFDCHLMIAPADPYISAFAEAGADIITVHPEAGPHIHRTVQAIRGHGLKAGVSLNPGTPASVLEPLLGDIDLVLVMSVNPGFGGQSFIDRQLHKIEAVRGMIDAQGATVELEVDGGINAQTARQCVDAGATVLVAGSAAFRDGSAHYAENLTALRQLA